MSIYQKPKIEATTDLRHALWANGYRTCAVYNYNATYANGTAIESAGKRPLGKNWLEQARCDPPHAVAHVDPSALNTGIICDALRAADIDIDNPDLVCAIKNLAFESLGMTLARFRANSPRILLAYRATELEPKKLKVAEPKHTAEARWQAENTPKDQQKPWAVEVLGFGQQFVAFGVHPSGVDYEWTDGASPVTLPFADLVAVSEEQINQFLKSVELLLGSAEEPRQLTTTPRPYEPSNPDATTADVRAALTAIPGDAGDYDTWIRVGLAVFAATAGSLDGLAAWDQWSQKSSAYSARAVVQKWQSFEPTSVGIGTLMHLAKAADPGFRAPSWRGNTPLAALENKQWKAQAPTPAALPDGYTVDAKGLWFTPAPTKQDADPEPIWLCRDRLTVLGKSRSAAGEDWSLALEIQDDDNRRHLWIMPRELLYGEPPVLIKELARRGLDCNVGKQPMVLLRNFLAFVQTDRYLTTVDRAGWHGTSYILPTGEKFGDDQIILQPHLRQNLTGEAGTLQD